MSEQHIAELVERLRSYHRGQVLSSVHIEAANALEALQAERDALKTTIAERTMHWVETSRELVDLRATIASLREALEEIAYTTPDGTEDSDLEIYKTLASKRARIARQALDREPDIGTTQENEDAS